MTGDVAVTKMSKQAKNYYSLQKRAKGNFLHLSTYLTPFIQIRNRTQWKQNYTKNIALVIVTNLVIQTKQA